MVSLFDARITLHIPLAITVHPPYLPLIPPHLLFLWEKVKVVSEHLLLCPGTGDECVVSIQRAILQGVCEPRYTCSISSD